jgi:hypothetical protein
MHAAAAGAERHDRPPRKSDPQPAPQAVPPPTAIATEKTTIES